MKKLRILSLMLALLTVVMLFASCKKDPEVPAEDPNAGNQETTLDIITEGVSSYVIVRDYKADGAVLDAINTVVTAVKEFTGADIVVKECYTDRQDENDVPTEKEILIGNTNRPETAEAFKGMRSNDWVIGVYGSKLVVGSPSDAGTLSAIAKLKNAYIYEQGNKYQVKSYVESNGREGSLMGLSISTSQGTSEQGTYSYSRFTVFDARVDSFLIAYAKSDDSAEGVAKTLQKHISKEAGYELTVKKDTRAYADYEILVGNTIRTEEAAPGIAAQLGPEDYYIKLVKRTVEIEGEQKEVVQLIVLYGSEAQTAVYQAFRKDFMPAQKTPAVKNVTESFTITTLK